MDQPFHVGIDILRCARRSVSKDLVAPVLTQWRLHWYGNRGATLAWNRRRIAALPDQVFIIAPRTPFERLMTQPVADHLFVQFRLDPARNRPANRIWSLPMTPGIRSSLSDLRLDLPGDGSPTVTAPWRAAGLVMNALHHIPEGDWPMRITDPRIGSVLRQIDHDVARPIDNRRVAKDLGLSASGFLRLFVRQTGITPQRYLSQRRIDLACRLLQGADIAIEEISRRCGFCDRTYFTTTFRRSMGMTPAWYRVRMSSDE